MGREMVIYKQVWSPQDQRPVMVTDVLDPENGSSRLSGVVRYETAIDLCEKAREKMKNDRRPR